MDIEYVDIVTGKLLSSIYVAYIVLGIIPAKINNDLKVETNYLNIKFLIWALVMTTLSTFNFKALIDFYDFQTFGPLEITKVIFYMMVQGLAPVFMGLIALVAKLIGEDSVEVNYQPSWKEKLANLFFMAFVFVMSYWLFTAKFIMNLFDQKDYVVLFSVIVQTILLHVVYHGTFFTGYIWLNDMILQGTNVIEEGPKISIEVADILIDKYHIFNKAFQPIVSFIYSSVLMTIIMSVYVAIKSKDNWELFSLLITLCLIMLTLVVTMLCEKAYSNLDEVADMLSDKAITVDTQREVLQYQRQAQKVRGYEKFTGFGFFEVDQTTLTAMAEIALTYIIVLAQAPA